ncbi:MAG: type III polyketide synthase, partial [Verrucomicrobiota bacterium]
MPSFLHSIETAVPSHRHAQSDLGAEHASWFEEERARRLISRASRNSGIESRHFVVEQFVNEAPFDERGEATTGSRNQVFAIESRKLAKEAAGKLLQQEGAPRKEEITHLIFVTCTGFVNPGPDFHLIRDLGLRESTERYVIGFMGCYGAFPALRMASQFCKADSEAKVLIVCLELCSLHVQRDGTTDSILGNTVFADGSAAAIVSSSPNGRPSYEIKRFASAVIPGSESAMAWGIGNRGFDLALSSYVPQVISSE